MPCCRSREPWVLNSRRSEFYLGLPSRGSVGEALSEINALSSESTVPKCHLSGGIWICKTFLPSGQLFISPEQEDIPRREVSEPCPALSRPAGGSRRELSLRSLLRALRSGGSPSTRAAPGSLRGLGSGKPLQVRLSRRLAKRRALTHLSPC